MSVQLKDAICKQREWLDAIRESVPPPGVPEMIGQRVTTSVERISERLRIIAYIERQNAMVNEMFPESRGCHDAFVADICAGIQRLNAELDALDAAQTQVKATIMDWLMERRTGTGMGTPSLLYDQMMENRRKLWQLYMHNPIVKAHVTAAIANEIPLNEMLVRMVLYLATQNAELLKKAVEAAERSTHLQEEPK